MGGEESGAQHRRTAGAVRARGGRETGKSPAFSPRSEDEAGREGKRKRGRGTEAPWMRPQRRKASQRRRGEKARTSSTWGTPRRCRHFSERTKHPTRKARAGKRGGGKGGEKKNLHEPGKSKRPPPTCGSPNWSLTLPGQPTAKVAAPGPAPRRSVQRGSPGRSQPLRPPLLGERGRAGEGAGLASALSPAALWVRPEVLLRGRGRRAACLGTACSLRLIFSKIDTKVGKAKSDP